MLFRKTMLLWNDAFVKRHKNKKTRSGGRSRSAASIMQHPLSIIHHRLRNERRFGHAWPKQCWQNDAGTMLTSSSKWRLLTFSLFSCTPWQEGHCRQSSWPWLLPASITHNPSSPEKWKKVWTCMAKAVLAKRCRNDAHIKLKMTIIDLFFVFMYTLAGGGIVGNLRGHGFSQHVNSIQKQKNKKRRKKQKRSIHNAASIIHNPSSPEKWKKVWTCMAKAVLAKRCRNDAHIKLKMTIIDLFFVFMYTLAGGALSAIFVAMASPSIHYP